MLSSTDTIPEETTDKFITLCIYSVVTTTGLWFHLDPPMALMLYQKKNQGQSFCLIESYTLCFSVEAATDKLYKSDGKKAIDVQIL